MPAPKMSGGGMKPVGGKAAFSALRPTAGEMPRRAALPRVRVCAHARPDRPDHLVPHRERSLSGAGLPELESRLCP